MKVRNMKGMPAYDYENKNRRVKNMLMRYLKNSRFKEK